MEGPATAPDLDGEASKVGLLEVAEEAFDRFECDLSRLPVVEFAAAAALAASFNLSCKVLVGLCPREVPADVEALSCCRSSSGR